MMNVRNSQPSSYTPQPMRAMPATHDMSSYRPASYQPVQHMVSPGQAYSQHSPHLSRILTQRPPIQTYPSPPNAYSQMTPQAHPGVPPPQYMARAPPQPQIAGYPHMLGHHPQHMQAHNPMSQQVGAPMQATHQYRATPQTVPMDHGVPPEGNFVYNGTQQQSFSLNTNNNSNNLSQAMYLTPEDRLSRLSEML